MTEPVTYEFQCMGSCIIPYIEKYRYSLKYPRKNDKPGFIKPKEGFEEWFKYINKIMYISTFDNNKGVDLTDILHHNEDDGVISNSVSDGILYDYDTVFFKFPNEELALYFQLKFCS